MELAAVTAAWVVIKRKSTSGTEEKYRGQHTPRGPIRYCPISSAIAG